MRFRFLKNVITLHRRSDVESAFNTCCILHNLILELDGLDILWESDVNWSNVNPEFENEESEGDGDELVYQDPSYDITLHTEDEKFVPTYVHDLLPAGERRIYEEEAVNFATLQMLLANNLQYMYRLGKLKWWPKVRAAIQGIGIGVNNNHNIYILAWHFL